jgi:hypothetical protein
MFEPMEIAARRIWETSPNCSDLGNFAVVRQVSTINFRT